MQFFNIIFIYLILGLLLAYPIFGLFQVLDGIIRYFGEGRSPEYYRGLRNYLKMVIFYFIGGMIIFCNPMRDFFLEHLEILPALYVFLVPIPIAVHKWQLSRKGESRPQENDILDESFIK